MGYGGLSAMVSDVDALIAEAKRAAPARAAGAGRTASAPRQSPSSGSRAVKALGIGLAGAALTIWIASLLGSQDGASAPPSTSAPSQSLARTTPPPSASAAQVASATGPARLAPRRSESSRELPASALEERPPAGSDLVFTAAQIRYCLSEDIRLESARDVALSNQDISRFNSMISDYNGRCGNYRYRPGVLESVREAVQPFTATLRAEGRARFGY